jgi:Transposase, Mutator family
MIPRLVPALLHPALPPQSAHALSCAKAPTSRASWSRAEQALVAVVQEAYVNGVSTRKVDRLVEQVGLHHLSKDQVSQLGGVVAGVEHQQ